MPDVSGASAVNTRVHTPTTKRTRGCGCIGHPAFPAPSDLQKAGNSRSNLAQTRGEIAMSRPRKEDVASAKGRRVTFGGQVVVGQPTRSSLPTAIPKPPAA